MEPGSGREIGRVVFEPLNEFCRLDWLGHALHELGLFRIAVQAGRVR